MRQVGMRWWVRGLSSTGAARFGCSPFTLLRNFSGKVAAAPFTVAAVQSPSPPWLMLPSGSVGDSDGDNDSQHDHEHYHLFSVAEKKVLKINKFFGIPWRRHHFCPEGFALCLGTSSYGWQTFVNKRTCKLFLFNPLGNPLNFSHTFIPLPPVESFRNCISSCHRQNIISTTSITEVQDVDSEYNFIGNESPLSPEWVSEHLIHKLVLSSPPLTGEDGSLAYNEDCLLMARLGFGFRFVCCRPGDTAWTSLNDGGIPYTEDDFIYFSKDQLFYSLTYFGNLESWDIRSPNSMNMRCPVYNSLPPKLQPTMNEHQIQLRVGSHNSYHLVESYGDLLLVVRYSRDSDSDVDCDGEKTKKKKKKKECTVAFDVYKFDFGRKKWVYVPNLGDDRVLFLGLNSFSVSLSDDRGLQGLISGNLIYFSFGKDQYHDSGIYHLDDGSITTFLPKCSSSQKNQFSSYLPIWIHPQL